MKRERTTVKESKNQCVGKAAREGGDRRAHDFSQQSLTDTCLLQAPWQPVLRKHSITRVCLQHLTTITDHSPSQGHPCQTLQTPEQTKIESNPK